MGGYLDMSHVICRETLSQSVSARFTVRETARPSLSETQMPKCNEGILQNSICSCRGPL